MLLIRTREALLFGSGRSFRGTEPSPLPSRSSVGTRRMWTECSSFPTKVTDLPNISPTNYLDSRSFPTKPTNVSNFWATLCTYAARRRRKILGYFKAKTVILCKNRPPGGPKFQQIFEKVKSSGFFLAEILKELRVDVRNSHPKSGILCKKANIMFFVYLT